MSTIEPTDKTLTQGIKTYTLQEASKINKAEKSLTSQHQSKFYSVKTGARLYFNN